ncbi:MAG: hypothetical protein ACE5KX_05340 [Acidimicrobiia bacterium]
MTSRLEVFQRPPPTADYTAPSKWLIPGIVIALAGMMGAVVTLIANLVAANGETESSVATILGWSFGVTTFSFGTIKFGIAVILIGILVRLWMRVDSVKASLPDLKAPAEVGESSHGKIKTEFGPAIASATEPRPLGIHRMAKTMWAPMLAMGVMALVVGLILSFVWAGEESRLDDVGAWTQGLQFLGEAFLLSGIAFLLGTILYSLRQGGGEVQESSGVTVKTLEMPATAKAFVGLMMLGLMISVAQFILYLASTTVDGTSSIQAWQAWLGPLRELGLGLILAGIVLALVTIGNVLGFQFSRIKEIIATGR